MIELVYKFDEKFTASVLKDELTAITNTISEDQRDLSVIQAFLSHIHI